MKKCDEFGRGGGSGAGCHGAVGKSGSVSGGTRSVVSGGHDRGIISRRTRTSDLFLFVLSSTFLQLQLHTVKVKQEGL